MALARISMTPAIGASCQQVKVAGAVLPSWTAVDVLEKLTHWHLEEQAELL
jgi:hypothetical protein